MDWVQLIEYYWQVIAANPVPFIVFSILFFLIGFGVCRQLMSAQLEACRERLNLANDRLDNAGAVPTADNNVLDNYKPLRIGIIHGKVDSPEAIPLTRAQLQEGNTMRIAIRMINAITKTPSDVNYLVYGLAKKSWIKPNRVMDLSNDDKIVLVQENIAKSWGNDSSVIYKIIANALSLPET